MKVIHHIIDNVAQAIYNCSSIKHKDNTAIQIQFDLCTVGLHLHCSAPDPDGGSLNAPSNPHS